MIIKILNLGQMGTNCYIVHDEASKEAAVFDPADEGEKIAGYIDSLSLDLKYVVITHAHCDHICALDYICRKYKPTLCAGKDDADAVNDDYTSLSSLFGRSAPKTKVQMKINENDEIKLGETSIKFLLTPGHTKGGVCAYFENNLISGDTLFRESVGRCDFPGGSMSQLVQSIRDKLFLLPDDTVVYPGHGEKTTIAYEKTNNPFVW